MDNCLPPLGHAWRDSHLGLITSILVDWLKPGSTTSLSHQDEAVGARKLKKAVEQDALVTLIENGAGN